MEYIGKTKCDDSRISREKDIEVIWNGLIGNEVYGNMYPLFWIAIDLFREATSCYQNGAYMGSAILCRSTIETAIYRLVSREIINYSSKDKMIWQMNVDLNFINEKWGEFFAKVKTKCSIDGRMEAKINKIRNAGNIVAHHGQIVDSKSLQQVIHGEDDWISREKAFRVMKKTVLVLNHLITDTFNKLPKEQV